MLNFRQFEAGPDPFGRKFQVYFKWQQNAISLRHADTVDVKFVLTDESGARAEKTIALPHPDLLALSRQSGHPLEDGWCARLAALHLLHLVATGEDIEKDLVTIAPADLRRYADEIRRKEQPEAAVGR
jgi:hypothetical protein